MTECRGCGCRSCECPCSCGDKGCEGGCYWKGKPCGYDMNYAGNCKKIVTNLGPWCDDHKKSKCWSCKKQAVYDCDWCGQFVCGAPCCREHPHSAVHNGTAGEVKEMSKAKYWWISGTENGLHIQSFSSSAELQEEIKDRYEGTEKTPQFLSSFPDRFDPEYFQGEILIKGEVIVPRRVLTVTEWRVD